LVTALFNVFLCLLIIPALGWKGAAIASISSDLGLTLMLLFALLKRINNEKVYLESNEKYF
jgi:Na+-driven multidrug efflux pump